jgi:hypothetical protein
LARPLSGSNGSIIDQGMAFSFAPVKGILPSTPGTTFIPFFTSGKFTRCRVVPEGKGSLNSHRNPHPARPKTNLDR